LSHMPTRRTPGVDTITDSDRFEPEQELDFHGLHG
jgi:hypothetical protein